MEYLSKGTSLVSFPVSVAAGTAADLEKEGPSQAICSNIGGVALGVAAALRVGRALPFFGGGLLAFTAGLVVSQAGNKLIDELWEWSENHDLLEALNNLLKKLEEELRKGKNFQNLESDQGTEEWSAEEMLKRLLQRERGYADYAERVRRSAREGTRRVYMIDPLVIDLDGDGIELRDIRESRAFFDLSGSGFANKVGWVSSDDALLVLDRNGNGRVDDISELFGSERQSGFAELALYDSNRDGRIDAFDEVFRNLKVWQDRDGDGRTDEGELLSLAEVGIKAISLKARRERKNVAGNEITEEMPVLKEKSSYIGDIDFREGVVL